MIAAKNMFDASSPLGDPMIAPLLVFGELTLGGPPLLNLRPKTIGPQNRLPRATGTMLAPVTVNDRAGVGSSEHRFKMTTVVNDCSIGLNFLDQLVTPGNAHRELKQK